MKRIVMGWLAACALAIGLLPSAAQASGYTQTKYPIVLTHGMLGFDNLLGKPNGQVTRKLTALATKYFKVMRKYGTDRLMTVPAEGKGGPVPFVLSQMPHDTQIEVDAHSNSPLFVEDQKNLAADLFKAKAIDRATLIEMVDPPMKAVMLRNLKKIEAKEAAAAAQQAQQQAQGGGHPKK